MTLNPVLRVDTQMIEAIQAHRKMNRKDARQRAYDALEMVGIPSPGERLNAYPHQLSGGMRQRVAIAIAFLNEPDLIIADEPTTALDVTVQKQILRLIRELQRQSDTAILFISHDMGVVAKLCDQVHVMHGGRILESSSADDLFVRPRHDYTKALLAATPRFDRPGDSLQPVPAELTNRLDAETLAWDRSTA